MLYVNSIGYETKCRGPQSVELWKDPIAILGVPGRTEPKSVIRVEKTGRDRVTVYVDGKRKGQKPYKGFQDIFKRAEKLFEDQTPLDDLVLD